AIFPPDVAYGALGHLHRAQRVAGRDTVRYAGAPIPMSFAEKRNAQSVCRVELSGGGVAIDLLPYEPQVALWSVPEQPGTIDEVLAALAELPQGEVTDGSPYLEIKVQMFGPDPTMRYKIEKALKGKSVRLTAILPFYPAKAAGDASAGGRDGVGEAAAQRTLSQIPPLGIAQEVYRKKYGVEMPEALQKLMSDVIKEVEA
ncbi:MAG: exonuclease SbcCD subunit D C-terminal domain-containing protein, partial [Bacteroidales bacterium]|nr:exonuclease SbcCD subunit D C-terminal domain-containing protein [Bacteroidales bacterium]